MNLVALVVLPFLAWHAYRVIHAFRTGVFESLGGAVDRASLPALYWFRVAREALLSALLAALFLSLLLGIGGSTLIWLFGGSFAIYVTILLATIYRRRRGSNTPLERGGSARRSGPG